MLGQDRGSVEWLRDVEARTRERLVLDAIQVVRQKCDHPAPAGQPSQTATRKHTAGESSQSRRAEHRTAAPWSCPSQDERQTQRPRQQERCSPLAPRRPPELAWPLLPNSEAASDHSTTSVAAPLNTMGLWEQRMSLLLLLKLPCECLCWRASLRGDSVAEASKAAEVLTQNTCQQCKAVDAASRVSLLLSPSVEAGGNRLRELLCKGPSPVCTPAKHSGALCGEVASSIHSDSALHSSALRGADAKGQTSLNSHLGLLVLKLSALAVEASCFGRFSCHG
jgi:hypothetical protein